MIKEQLLQARELIQQKRYADARAILQRIDHPTAHKWLAKLDELRGTETGTAPPLPDPDDHDAIRARLLQARDHIYQREFEAARALLTGLDHPTAQKWLARLDDAAAAAEAESQPAPAAPPAPAPKPESAPEAAASDDRADQEARLREAQALILASHFDEAKTILDTLTIPEAAIWQDKTQMNKFREFPSVWLDLYYYHMDFGGVPPEDPDNWRCAICGRGLAELPQCPDRGHPSCPQKIMERTVEEPNRLALVLGAIHMDNTGSIKSMLASLNAEQLGRWRAYLQHRLGDLWERDVRRPTLETAVILLYQLEQTRRFHEPLPGEDSEDLNQRIAELIKKIISAFRSRARE